MNDGKAVPVNRMFALFVGASALLLVAFLEALFVQTLATPLVVATLFGVPVGWLALRSAARIQRIEIDVFSPFVAFPVAYVFWFGLGSLTFILDANPPPYFYMVLGFLAYIAGASITASVSAVVQETYRVPKRIPWGASHFRFVMLVLFLLMAGSYLLLISQIGIPALHEDVAIRREALGLHHYLVDVLLSSALTVTSFAAADLWSETRILSPVVSGGMVIVAFLMQGSFGNRGFVATPLLLLLVLWHYWKKPIQAKRLAVICAALFVAFTVYDYTRGSALRVGADADTAYEIVSSSGSFTLHTNVANLRDVVEAIPAEIPYQHGNLTFGAFFQVLPGHHESSDAFFKRILANDFEGGGQPATLLAPFYGDFGVAGILTGMFLFGAFSVKVHRWMREHPTLFRILIYSWLAQTALFALYGDLFTYIMTLWVPLLWWVLDRGMGGGQSAVDQWYRTRVRSPKEA